MTSNPLFGIARDRRIAFVISSLTLLVGDVARAAEVVIDCSNPIGTFRPLHGVNKGPLDAGGTVDLSAHFKALGVPLTRLHDCHWPNPDVVDMHAVFPNPDADPSKAESYDFARTDEYVAATLATGSKIVYRLGQSIEHGSDKRRVTPPADPQKWAAICLGIIRHYNAGWASGFRYNIRYWEIWNEPENRPSCWTGTDAEYFALYKAAATAIEREFPDVRVGGPAVGNTGAMEGQAFKPSAFTMAFLDYCKREAVPLDFFSWHLYAADPRAVLGQARGVRALLDAKGFEKVESHLNEWNYLPDDSWGPMSLKNQGRVRQRWLGRVGGAEGAAFAAATLILLQDAPVDAANYFAGDTQGFGLFTAGGVPRKSFHAFEAFRALLDTPVRLRTTVARSNAVFAAAGVNREGTVLSLLVSNLGANAGTIDVAAERLPWKGPTYYSIQRVDGNNDMTLDGVGELSPRESKVAVPLGGHASMLVTLRKVR